MARPHSFPLQFLGSPRYFWPEHAEQSPHSDQAPRAESVGLPIEALVEYGYLYRIQEI